MKKIILLVVTAFSLTLLNACGGGDGEQLLIDESLVGHWIFEPDSGVTRELILNDDGSGRGETSFSSIDMTWSTMDERLTITVVYRGEEEEEIWTYYIIGDTLTLTQISPTEGFELVFVRQ